MFILVLGYKNEQPSSRATKWRGDPNEQRAVATFGLLRRFIPPRNDGMDSVQTHQWTSSTYDGCSFL